MIFAVLLALVAIVLALRADAAARSLADRFKTVNERLTSIQQELWHLRSLVEPTPHQTTERQQTSFAEASAPAQEKPAPEVAVAQEPLPPPVPATPVHADQPSPVLASAADEVRRTRRGSPAGLEGEIGGRWMLVAGVVVLVLGVGFFVKYAFDRRWITEAGRVAIGTVAGVAVWMAGLQFARRSYVLFGRMVAGGGLAIMFVSAWAATALYRLVSIDAGFLWIVAVSAVAVVTSDQQKSMGLALMAVVFAYAAPGIVPSEADHHIVLFLYESMLAVATLVLVHRHGWPVIAVVSWYLSWTTIGFWQARWYRDDVFAQTELYLAFQSSIFVVVSWLLSQRRNDPVAKAVSYVLYAGPALFHLASIAVLFNHAPWFLVYLVVVTAAAVALATDRPVARLLAWFVVAMPLAIWTGRYGPTRWFIAGLLAAASIYGVHLWCQLLNFGSRKKQGQAELALFQFNALGIFLVVYLLVEPHAISTPATAAIAAGWYWALSWKLQRFEGLVPHALASAFTLTAATVWLALTGPWLTVAMAAEGAAIIVVGLRADLVWFRFGGALVLAFAAARLVVLQFGHTPVAFTPLLNSRTLTGAFIVALLYAIAREYRRRVAQGEGRRAAPAAVVAANLLTVGLLTADADSFWATRSDQFAAAFSRQLSVSVIWGLYAMGDILIGFARRSATLRFFGLALFGFTTLKMFAVDLLQLDGVYRISGFIAVGLVLLSASFLYQRRRASIAP